MHLALEDLSRLTCPSTWPLFECELKGRSPQRQIAEDQDGAVFDLDQPTVETVCVAANQASKSKKVVGGAEPEGLRWRPVLLQKRATWRRECENRRTNSMEAFPARVRSHLA